MNPTVLLAASAAAVLLVLALVSILPRAAIGKAQDRLAERVIAASSDSPSLLTRAELVAGRYRRLPGILGLSGEAVTFEGIFGDRVELPTSRIAKIATGRRLSSGRLLFRMEVLRIWRGPEEIEFVLTRASASAWRSHLGLWAMAERVKEAESAGAAGSAERVVPGRS